MYELPVKHDMREHICAWVGIVSGSAVIAAGVGLFCRWIIPAVRTLFVLLNESQDPFTAWSLAVMGVGGILFMLAVLISMPDTQDSH